MPKINTKTYKKYQQVGSRVEYRGPDHTDLDDDILVMQSSDPTRTRTSFGNRRGYATLARGVTTKLRGTVETEQSNASIKLVSSVPAGATASEVEAIIADFKAFASDEALIRLLVIGGQIDHD